MLNSYFRMLQNIILHQCYHMRRVQNYCRKANIMKNNKLRHSVVESRLPGMTYMLERAELEIGIT